VKHHQDDILINQDLGISFYQKPHYTARTPGIFEFQKWWKNETS